MNLQRARNAVAVGLALTACCALADEKKVHAHADIVFASKESGAVDPSLAPMQETLSARVKYLTLKKLSSHQLELSAAVSKVSLPNQKTAELTLISLSKDNVAQVHVKVPPLEATYSLGKGKSLFVQAGVHEAGELWLVISQPK
jgi:hypothetical protein